MCQLPHNTEDKIDYHVNPALTAVNAAKIEHDVQADQSFLMADVKRLYHNQLLLERFISILPQGVELDKNDPKVRELYTFGCKAA